MDFSTRKTIETLGHDPTSISLDNPNDIERALELATTAFLREDLRWGAIGIAGEILTRWRTPFPQLIDNLLDCVAHDDAFSEFRHRDAAGNVLAALAADQATDISATIPALAMAVRDETLENFRRCGGVVLALARLGHPAAILPVQRRLADSARWWFLPFPLSVNDVLTPMVDQSEVLLPAISGSFGPHLLATMAAWGPAAAPIVPDLQPLLRTESALEACFTLGSIGSAAAPAADQLRVLANCHERPPRYGGTSPQQSAQDRRTWHGAQTAAWAHWRATGDPDTALAVLGAAAASATDHAAFAFLADLGAHASAHAEAVRAHFTSPGTWIRINAAYAWWRITGDPEPAVPVLIDALKPLQSGFADAECRTAVRYLAEIGTPAAPAIPLLETVLASEHRYSSGPRGSSHRAPAEDADLCIAARAVIAA